MLDPLKVKWPDNAYAFTLHKREDVVDGDARYTGKAVQVGPMYYHPDSRIETLEEVRRNLKRGPCLVSNMEANGWQQVIWTRWGNWPQPFNADKMTILSGGIGGER